MSYDTAVGLGGRFVHLDPIVTDIVFGYGLGPLYRCSSLSLSSHLVSLLFLFCSCQVFLVGLTSVRFRYSDSCISFFPFLSRLTEVSAGL